MSSGALALLIRTGVHDWTAGDWKASFEAALPGRKVALLPKDALDPADVRYAATWGPRPGELAQFPNLTVIFNLGVGVDALLADPSLPPVPVVRVVDGDMTGRMTEYIVMHVLLHHRQHAYLGACQARREWAPPEQWAAGAVRVGLLGLGVLGSDAAAVLSRLGFQVAGWSRTPKAIPGIDCYSGEAELGRFLARTDILVSILPLTAETRGILNRPLFEQLARDGKLGGPVLINAGRGGLQSETDILACLDDGTLKAATLDVFETEPLPADSPLWTHPGVTITPHNAADSEPGAISRYIAGEIARFEAGEPLRNLVDRSRGY